MGSQTEESANMPSTSTATYVPTLSTAISTPSMPNAVAISAKLFEALFEAIPQVGVQGFMFMQNYGQQLKYMPSENFMELIDFVLLISIILSLISVSNNLIGYKSNVQKISDRNNTFYAKFNLEDEIQKGEKLREEILGERLTKEDEDRKFALINIQGHERYYMEKLSMRGPEGKWKYIAAAFRIFWRFCTISSRFICFWMFVLAYENTPLTIVASLALHIIITTIALFSFQDLRFLKGRDEQPFTKFQQMVNLLTNITMQIFSPIYLSLWDAQIKPIDEPLHLLKPQYTTPREKIEEYNNILDIHNIPNGVQWRYLHRRKPLVGPGDESNETREIDSNSSDIVRWCKKDGYAWRLIAELDDELDANGNFENKILLQSNDDEVFEVDEYVIRLSTKLQIPAQGTDEEDTVEAPILKIKEANSAILKKVIEWCHYHKADPLPQDESNTTIPNWDAEFLKVDNATLFKLTMAADYLGIQGLIDVTYELVANVLE
uniref:XK-related protein n=1 Tax=Acrobeloides nanus TaxID=290746 RepID=A0A914C6K4_9BILA